LEEEIITDLSVLQSSLDKMIARVEERDTAIQQFQAFQTTLFTVNSLSEMIEAVLAQAKLFFKQDIASLALLNADAKIAGYLQDSGYDYQKNKQLLLLNDQSFANSESAHTAFIGQYEQVKHSVFFASPTKPITDVVIIPLIRHGEYLGTLSLASEKANSLASKTKLEFVGQIGFCISICLENHLNFAIARQAYRNEALANANNRRFLEQRLVEELERGHRSTDSLSCMMIDVAFPQLKNHDENVQLELQVLKTVAETIKRQLRVGDVFSYYEGKKFAAFLSNAPEDVVTSISERLKTTLLEQVIKFSNQIIPLTISLGIANRQLDKQAQPDNKTNQQIALELLSTADENLYKAKHNNSSQPKKITAA
jgi:diguanylate cyclase (GGDEF)-like protein